MPLKEGARMRILVMVDACGPGDVLRISSCFQAVRACHAAARLDLLAGERVAPLFEHLSLFDRIVVSQLYKSRKDASLRRVQLAKLREVVRLISKLGPRYDEVLTFWGGTTLLNLVGRLVGRRLIGHVNGLPRLLSTASAGLGRYDHREDAITQNLAVLRAAGIPLPAVGSPVRIHAMTDEVAAARLLHQHGLANMGAGPLVLLHPGSDWACQQWRSERWAVLASRLASEYEARVVFTGTATERGVIEAIRSQMSARSVSLAGQTTLAQLGALLGRAQLCVCVDSAVYELTQAAGIPAVVLAGPSPAERTIAGPRPPMIINRASPQLRRAINDCKELSFDSVRQSGCLNYACPMAGMRDIRVEDVLEAIAAQGVLRPCFTLEKVRAR